MYRFRIQQVLFSIWQKQDTKVTVLFGTCQMQDIQDTDSIRYIQDTQVTDQYLADDFAVLGEQHVGPSLEGKVSTVPIDMD